MRGRVTAIGICFGFFASCIATAQPAEDRHSFSGNWRGSAIMANGEAAQITLSVREDEGIYYGSISGFVSRELSLEQIRVDQGRLHGRSSIDSDVGSIEIELTLSLNREANKLSGTQHITIGELLTAFDVELTKRRRRNVAQPQIEQSLSYFVGHWEFSYTGGEFPPLSHGTRAGQVTFTQRHDTPFLDGTVTGNIFGDNYEERIVIGYDEQSDFLAYKETFSSGFELLSIADWSSPIAINFTTIPVESDGTLFQLRRVISITSVNAFRVTEEFSVDHGPFKRLGNAIYQRSPSH